MRRTSWVVHCSILFLPVMALLLNGCNCGGVDEDYCKELGLKYKEKDGKGYCYEKGKASPADTDCKTAKDGTICDDGDACTFSDVCVAATGECTGTPLSGIDDGNPCTEDTCDPLTGAIAYDRSSLNGEPCDDEDICSGNDSCNEGICSGDYTVDSNGDPIDDNDACTADSCDSAGVRQNVPYTAAEAAALGLGDVTVEAVANPCQQYQCSVGLGQTPHMVALDAIDCSDAAAGRTNGDCVAWTCQTGTCAALVDEDVVQNAPVQQGLALHPNCRMRECNTSSGAVSYVVDPRMVETGCDDDNPCTFDDACQSDGSCLGRELAHGTLCNDDNPCTVGDYCHMNECRSGMDYLALANEVADPLVPDPNDDKRDPAGIVAEANPCQAYACDPVRGVVVVDQADGSSCDDHNPCTAASACQGGLCVGTRETTNDGQVCSVDGNVCLSGYCDKGVCINMQPNEGQSCEGVNPCKTYTCSSFGICDVEAGNVSNTPEVICREDPLTPCIGYVCEDGTCTPKRDYFNGQSCDGGDPRCNAPTCNSNGQCEPNQVANDTPCTLSDIDLVNLECNIGTCQGTGGLIPSTCVPEPAREEESCDDGNVCNGADWCQMGLCRERYSSADPSDPDPSDPSCANNPVGCYDNAVPTTTGATECNLDGTPETVGRCKYDGSCVEISQVVDDNNGCTVPVWNETTGALVMEAVANDTPCHVVNINPCIENLGSCVDGECHTNPMPDGSLCDLAAQAVPTVEDLPQGHALECYQEVCIAGQCVVDTSLQDGDWCNDGETICTFPGACNSGACDASTEARGYGETCMPEPGAALVDLAGNAIAAKDVGCWASFECSETGSCNVVVAKQAQGTPCDFDTNGDTCDGRCDDDGICESANVAEGFNPTCDDGSPCTVSECDGNGSCKTGAATHRPDGPVVGLCEGPVEGQQCQNHECQTGVCAAVDSPNGAFCDDGNACTVTSCQTGSCQVQNTLPENSICEPVGTDGDADCIRFVCNAAGECAKQENENDNSPCNSDDPCSQWTCQGGICEHANNIHEDGVNCDSNGVPCDEACLDIDGPNGDGPSTCVSFNDYYGLLTATNMAANADAMISDGEEEACRQLYDPTYDSLGGTGHSCSRFVCYFGECRPWDDNLPAALTDNSNAANYGSNPLGPHPQEGVSCGESGQCTTRGVCSNNICNSYHHLPDGTLCGQPSCGEQGELVLQPTCEAGACVFREELVGSCSLGLATCQGGTCEGGDCPYTCKPQWFDYVNVFEDISSTGDSRRSELRSPLDLAVTCLGINGAATSEERRRACDDGSVFLNLQNDLGVEVPGAWDGAWFYNRRYTNISISVNGTVMFHRENLVNLEPDEDVLFVLGNVGGGTVLANNDGENVAQIRAFRDDLTFITDINVDPSDIPSSQTENYGNFTTFGDIYTERMTGPTDSAWDDYIIIQWQDAAFYGCAVAAGSRSSMTFQMKWWPSTGQIALVYPDGVNSDAEGSGGPYCLPGRTRGVNASIGLYDENAAPSSEVGVNTWMVVNESGPLSDTFDGYYLFWPTDKPITNYDWRGVEWFDDITVYDASRGDSMGEQLQQVSNCNECCERVDLDPPVFFDGRPRHFMHVCADGYLHFMDYRDWYYRGDSLDNRTQNNYDATNVAGDVDFPKAHAAPFWTRLYPEANPNSGVYWLDYTVGGQRRIVVQWHLMDYLYRADLANTLPLGEQERGEWLCSDNTDNDGDSAVDCDDTSCGCAVACGGLGCGLTFEAIVYPGLGSVEFRYLDDELLYRHAQAGAAGAGAPMDGAALGIGLDRGNRPAGIDLLDGDSGSQLPFAPHPADVDEQWPGQQLNIVLPQNAFLLPYIQDVHSP